MPAARSGRASACRSAPVAESWLRGRAVGRLLSGRCGRHRWLGGQGSAACRPAVRVRSVWLAICRAVSRNAGRAVLVLSAAQATWSVSWCPATGTNRTPFQG